MMNSLRPKLCEIVARYGTSICDDPVRCEGFIRDFCGPHRREIFILVSALKEGIPADLLSFRGKMLLDLRITHLTERLHSNMSFERDAARWGVESWALALGVIDIADLERRNVQDRIATHSVPNKVVKADLHDTTKTNASSIINVPNADGRSYPTKVEVGKQNVWIMLSIFYFGFVIGWILSRMC